MCDVPVCKMEALEVSIEVMRELEASGSRSQG